MSIRKFKINIEGKSFVAEVEEIGGSAVARTASQTISSRTAPSAPVAPVAGNAIVSPMPGKVISIKVKKGQPVKEGDSGYYSGSNENGTGNKIFSCGNR